MKHALLLCALAAGAGWTADGMAQAQAPASTAPPGGAPAPTAPPPFQRPKVDQAPGQTLQKRSISAKGAQMIVDAAVAEATRNKHPIAIGIVDDGGNLLIFHRMDGISLGTIDAVLNKARSALRLQMSTGRFSSNPAMALSFMSSGFTVLNGGEPIRAGDQVVGAIAVSGGSRDEDESYIRAGLAAWKP